MSPSQLFRVNTKNVVSDLVEDEVIIVDLKSGSYYSLTGVGAHIWTCLESGMDVATVIRSVAATYDGGESEITDVVKQLIAELAAENLVVSVPPENGQVPVTFPPSLAPASSSNKKNLLAPILAKYTDMQELLLIDPVHDVDDEGWPVLKKENLQ